MGRTIFRSPGIITPGFTQGSGGPYIFDHFIAPTAAGGNINNDGTSPVPVGPQPGKGPWHLSAINLKQTGPNSYTQLGVVADQGPYNFLTEGISYNGFPNNNFQFPVLNCKAGTAATPIVVACCNSSGQYIPQVTGAQKCVVDGNCSNPPAYGYDLYFGGAGGIIGQAYTSGGGYLTIDGFEFRNGGGHGIHINNTANVPNVNILNCLVHHFYNYNEGYTGTGSCTNGILTMATVTNGLVADLNNSVPNPPNAGGGDSILSNNGARFNGTIDQWGTNSTTGRGGTGTYQTKMGGFFSVPSNGVVTFTGAGVGGASSGTLISTNAISAAGPAGNGTYTFKFSDGEFRQVTVAAGGTSVSWTGALNPGSILTATVYCPDFAGPIALTGSAQDGNNQTGIAIENITNSFVTNCFVYAIVDLNTAIPNNFRAAAIKSFNCEGLTVDLTTIYADPVTKMPLSGINTKDLPNYNFFVKRCFLHMANASVASSEAHPIGADLTAGTGRSAAFTNNITVHPILAGIPQNGSGGPGWNSMPTLWAFNTCVVTGGVNACQGFVRFADHPAGALNVSHYSNVYYYVNGGTNSSNGVIESGADVFHILDFDVIPPAGANGQMFFQPVGGGNGQRFTLPLQLAAFRTFLSPSTAGGEANGHVGIPTLTNGTGTRLKATDYQLAGGSVGSGQGSIDGISAASTDCGAWGAYNGVAPGMIGCQWMDPF